MGLRKRGGDGESALSGLGERESSTKRLEEAVDAFRAALQECTRGRVPLDWAGAQNNIGNALMRLGERTHGGQLEEARKSISAAFDFFMQARPTAVPGLSW